jgi:uncharacterized protein
MEKILSYIKLLDGAVVAFSGGVDSTLLAKLAFMALGDRAVAITAVSPSLPKRERENAICLAKDIGIAHVLMQSNELDDPRYQENTPQRCYWCKGNIAGMLVGYAHNHGYAAVLDGNNLDDISDTRPGRKAAQEAGLISPFIEMGWTKARIRETARELGLSNWDHPAAACLSSRIPYGTRVTADLLAKIDAAETALGARGFRQVRVRAHQDVARIEVLPEDLAAALSQRLEILDEMRAAGFAYAALDLAGYRTGSLNETVKKP